MPTLQQEAKSFETRLKAATSVTEIETIADGVRAIYMGCESFQEKGNMLLSMCARYRDLMILRARVQARRVGTATFSRHSLYRVK
jgi:hypothetical protein